MNSLFLIIAVAMVALALLFVLPPLFRPRGPLSLILIIVIALPLASWYSYLKIGTTEALLAESHTQQAIPGTQQSMASAIAELKARLIEYPKDIDGWMLLGRSLSSTDHPEQAEKAYRTALTLDADNAFIKMELANAILSNSQPPVFPSEAKSLLQEAYTADPGLQKAQWLLGIAEASAGNDQLALDLWQDLLPKLEPGSNIAATVASQITNIKARLGMKPAGIQVRIELASSVSTVITPQTVLFVFLRSPDSAGMPLAVKRIPAPQLPLSIELTDESVLQAGKSLTDFPELLLSAKLSPTGSADVHPEDLGVPAVLIKPDNSAVTTLILHKQVSNL